MSLNTRMFYGHFLCSMKSNYVYITDITSDKCKRDARHALEVRTSVSWISTLQEYSLLHQKQVGRLHHVWACIHHAFIISLHSFTANHKQMRNCDEEQLSAHCRCLTTWSRHQASRWWRTNAETNPERFGNNFANAIITYPCMHVPVRDSFCMLNGKEHKF